MAGYNDALCAEKHCVINKRFDKGDERMDCHECSINDHEQRLSIAEEIARRQTSLFWNLITPVLSFVGAIGAGFILAWFLQS